MTDAMAALEPIFDAMRRGTKRNRLCQWKAVCKEGHTLAEVFRTSAGPVVLSQDHSGTWGAVFVPDDPSSKRLVFLNPCACQQSMGMKAGDIRASLDAGERRYVVRRWSETLATRHADTTNS